MKKAGVILLLLALILFSNLVSAGELKVTREHPFLIIRNADNSCISECDPKSTFEQDFGHNGEWVSANQLNVGDKLTLADGRKAVIKNIKRVVPADAFKVYNLETENYHDFVVGNDRLVVHNSNALPISLRQNLRELNAGELETILEEAKELTYSPNLLGAYKEGVAFDGIPKDFPRNIKKAIEEAVAKNKIPPLEREFILKRLRNSGSNLLSVEHEEAILEKLGNYKLEAELPGSINAGLRADVGYDVVPPTYFSGFRRTETVLNGAPKAKIEGIFLQKRIRGTSVRSISIRFRRMAVTGVLPTDRIPEEMVVVVRKINEEIDRVYPFFDKAVKQTGVRIMDLNNGNNILIQFYDKCNKRILSTGEVFGRNGVPIETIGIRMYTPDIGYIQMPVLYPSGVSGFARVEIE